MRLSHEDEIRIQSRMAQAGRRERQQVWVDMSRATLELYIVECYDAGHEMDEIARRLTPMGSGSYYRIRNEVTAVLARAESLRAQEQAQKEKAEKAKGD